MKSYNPKDIEPKWQQIWADTGIYKAVDFDNKPKFVMLTEFPYPSGDGLHSGHAREYTIGDVIARYKRMQGYNVLYPMGYDAFGLPTENYAIKNKIRPQDATAQNVANFRKQFDSLGYSFDWDREVNTTDPNYYKWTQWLFLQFYKEGLAYRQEMAINWCPKCKTGLANEEVVNGRHERCDTLVEKKLLNQWMLGITKYADRLIEGLKTVDYPDRISSQQINWIGRSEGAEIDFKIGDDTITVYTTRPDTLAGATFMVLAPEHPLVEKITTDEHRAHVNTYVQAAGRKSEIARADDTKEKTGAFTGSHATNPLTGEQIPVWIADYVMMGYGTGAIMAVPAHDQRDYDFATRYQIPIKQVIEGGDLPFTDVGVVVNSGEFTGLSSTEAKTKITEHLEKQGVARKSVKYRLRDWVFSRQHYWGEPIPIIHCEKDGMVPVPEDQLPVVLPDVESYEPTDDGRSPLALIEDWVNVECPLCGGPAKRETDTMPNWAGSSWYYLRYFDAKNHEVFADPEKLKYWGAVDMYLGGMEHTTLHLLYSRFWHQFFYDQKLVPTPEPYTARRGQGIVLAADGRKMSKSLGNVINPTDVIAKTGADALRLYILFMAPYDESTPWSEEHLAGVSRFLYRAWDLLHKPVAESADSLGMDRVMHKAIQKVGDHIEQMRFNTAVSSLMECVNALNKFESLTPTVARQLALILAPLAPHMAEEVWHELGEPESIHVTPWPSFDPELVKDDVVEVAIQVNGKLRGTMPATVDASKEELETAAKEVESVQKYLESGEIVKTIVVPNKMVSFVVKN